MASSSAAALLPRFLHVYPFQPATALWRATEIAALAEHGLPSGRGLDLGCGDGLLTSLTLDACGQRELAGIDPDPQEIELARESELYSELFETGGDALPFEDETFDFVLSNSVLEHIPDVRPVLREAARVLKSGGEFIATVPAPDFHRLLRGQTGGRGARSSYLKALDARLAHFYYWDEATWHKELEDAGLQLQSATPYLNRAQTRRWETISRATAGALTLAFRGKRPIEIQRSLGLRRADRRMPLPLASILARVLSCGVDLSPDATKRGGCWLLHARKPTAP